MSLDELAIKLAKKLSFVGITKTGVLNFTKNQLMEHTEGEERKLINELPQHHYQVFQAKAALAL